MITDRLYSASDKITEAKDILARLGYTDIVRSLGRIQTEVRDLAEIEYEKDVSNRP